MSSRWNEFPISEQEQKYLASTTTSPPPLTSSITSSIRQQLGKLLRQEISDDQSLCYYQNLRTEGSPITYLCELGCCQAGCCTPEDLTSQAGGYGWAIGLLVAFILLILFAAIALLAVWLINRHKAKMQKRELQGSTADSSAASQISGPTSYYSPDTYFPYTYYESKY